MKLAPVAFSLAAMLFLGGSAARAQSLGDVAKKTEETRKKTAKAPTKVYTNDDLKKYAPPPAPADAAGAAGAAAAPSGEQPAPGEQPKTGADQFKQQPAPPEEQKDEAYWKNLITTARAKLERDQSYFEALQTRINSLSNDFYARDDPAQRDVIWKQRTKALEDLEQLKKDIADDNKAIAKIQEDARREGVPPGWLR
jgi:hypothetical protein